MCIASRLILLIIGAISLFALNAKNSGLLLRNIFESSLMKQCEYAVRRYVDSVLNIQDVEDEDREIIIRYLKCLAFGTVIDWFENGMNENIIEHFHRLCELKSGQTAEMIERCRRK